MGASSSGDAESREVGGDRASSRLRIAQPAEMAGRAGAMTVLGIVFIGVIFGMLANLPTR